MEVQRPQRPENSLELELQVVVSDSMWVLGNSPILLPLQPPTLIVFSHLDIWGLRLSYYMPEEICPYYVSLLLCPTKPHHLLM